MMDKQALSRLERFKARLGSERQLLLSELEDWLQSQTELACITLFEQLHQLNNDELLESLQQLENPKSSKIRSRLQAIDASLCQLELGLYGYCADCEKTIEPELLQRDPTSQRCRRCDSIHQNSKKTQHRILL